MHVMPPRAASRTQRLAPLDARSRSALSNYSQSIEFIDADVSLGNNTLQLVRRRPSSHRPPSAAIDLLIPKKIAPRHGMAAERSTLSGMSQGSMGFQGQWPRAPTPVIDL